MYTAGGGRLSPQHDNVYYIYIYGYKYNSATPPVNGVTTTETLFTTSSQPARSGLMKIYIIIYTHIICRYIIRVHNIISMTARRRQYVFQKEILPRARPVVNIIIHLKSYRSSR